MSLEINPAGDTVEEYKLCTQNGNSSDLDCCQWQITEKQLNNRVEKLETELTEEKCHVTLLQDKIKLLEEERDIFKHQVTKLEKELTRNSLKGSKSEEVNDAVTKAKSVIFEKTKMCKNQELQIDALKQQVLSLKEIVAITKDMLEIRNIEVKQLQDKLECMELKFTAERDRHELMHTKLDRMIKLNADLKCEYQKQLELFTELQKTYHQKQAAIGKAEELKEQS